MSTIIEKITLRGRRLLVVTEAKRKELIVLHAKLLNLGNTTETCHRCIYCCLPINMFALDVVTKEGFLASCYISCSWRKEMLHCGYCAANQNGLRVELAHQPRQQQRRAFQSSQPINLKTRHPIVVEMKELSPSKSQCCFPMRSFHANGSAYSFPTSSIHSCLHFRWEVGYGCLSVASKASRRRQVHSMQMLTEDPSDGAIKEGSDCCILTKQLATISPHIPFGSTTKQASLLLDTMDS